MPELPEVETIRLDLVDYLSFPAVINRFDIRDSEYFLKHSNIASGSSMLNKSILGVKRHGKKLLFELDDGYLVFHLGMSGQIISDPNNSKYPKHIKLEMLLGDFPLYFLDIRKFGYIKYFPQLDDKLIKNGKDPIVENISHQWLESELKKRKAPIKTILMDQNLVAGIGNIYASEILFCSGISPYRPGNKLTQKEIGTLIKCTDSVLRDAIQRFGTTFSIFQNLKGREGKNVEFLQVYLRDNQPCFRCGTEILKVQIGNRSTYYCPSCQR
ncbi:MAG: bifunctional DNA-formamidopyrimidine glycosylase/DNA-(apurinic or apyrimidinic site) lyase [Calditrichia bacterium]